MKNKKSIESRINSKMKALSQAIKTIRIEEKFSSNLWEDNNVQFTRLVAEINSVGLSESQYKQLSESMDLPIEKIDELFDRAIEAFEKIKDEKLP